MSTTFKKKAQELSIIGAIAAASGAVTGAFSAGSLSATGNVQGANLIATDDALIADDVTFDVAGASATISQATDATNSATCDPLTMVAQTCSGTTSTGGTVAIKSGDGTSADGEVLITRGSDMSVLGTTSTTVRLGGLLAGARPSAVELDAAGTLDLRIGGNSRLSITNTSMTLPSGVATTLRQAAIAERWDLTGDISPAQLANGNNNNWAPTGITTASVIRADVAAGAILTGISAGQGDGRILIIFNISTNDLLVDHNDADSSSANQISTPNSAQMTIRDNESLNLWYDSTSTKWRVFN